MESVIFQRRGVDRAGFGSTGVRTRAFLVLATVVCALVTRPATAGTVTWGASGTGGDGGLDAEADFTISNGKIVVTITNLLDPSVIKSAGQAVSDLSFTLSNSPGIDSSNTVAGSLVDVFSDGTHTAVSGSPGRWIGLEVDSKNKVLGGFGISGTTITLETIGGGQPSEMILPSDNGGNYTNANKGSLGGGQFNAWVDGPATFTLNLSGVTDSTTITGVTFSFGTSPDTFLTGTPGLPPPPPQLQGAPEPVSLAVWGLLGLGGVVCRRRRKTTAT
jgi:MYXO-CTERM domain-containing protein